jgi:hypothetical protein
MVDVLERGDIFFVYRPRVQEDSAEGLEDVQRSYMVLSPEGKQRHRLIVLGQKRLPKIRDGGDRVWGYVDMVERDPRKIEDELDRQTYRTKTRGQRVRPEARPAGEGVYAIVRHEDHTHLAYELELPTRPGEVQEELEIEPEASYIISIKNPDAPSPPGVGLRGERKVDFPRRLQEQFRGRRFADADPPELLDYEGAEVLLIGAEEDVSEDLGIQLNPERETAETAQIFTKLKLEKGEHPTEPLTKGEWR